MSQQSPVFSFPSQLNSPTNSVVNAVVSPHGTSHANADSGTDGNNNMPSATPQKQATACQTIRDTSSSTAAAVSLPPIGKKTQVESSSKNKIQYPNAENPSNGIEDQPLIRKSKRLQQSKSDYPMGGIKYV